MSDSKKYVLDCRHLRSPKPLMMVREKLERLESGDRLKVLITDPQCEEVIPIYMDSLGHRLVGKERVKLGDEEYVMLEFVIE